MSVYKYITDAEKVAKVLKYYDMASYPNETIKRIFKDFDGVIEVLDYDVIINNSVLKNELSKIERMRAVFTQLNNITLKEKGYSEIDELEETDDKEILNRNLVLDLRRRGFAPKNSDAIYFKNKEDLSYNDVKSYFLEIGLPWALNRNFEAIARRMKKAIASKNQQFTFFQGIDLLTDYSKNYLLIIPELKYSNERFGKEIYKLFLPYTTLVNCEIGEIATGNSLYGMHTMRHDKVIRLAHL